MKIQELLERNIIPFRSEIDAAAGIANDPEILSQIIAKLAPRVKVLGHGGFGLAVDIPGSNWVLKVWHANDVGYSQFVDFCQTIKSPHIPRFQDYRSLRNIRRGSLTEDVNNIIGHAKIKSITYNYCIVERLQSLPDGGYLNEYLPYFAWLAYRGMLYAVESKEVIAKLKYQKSTRDIMKKYDVKHVGDLREPGVWRELEGAMSGPPRSWKIAANHLLRFKERNVGSGLMYDLHELNVMRRGSIPVFSDPFSSTTFWD